MGEGDHGVQLGVEPNSTFTAIQVGLVLPSIKEIVVYLLPKVYNESFGNIYGFTIRNIFYDCYEYTKQELNVFCTILKGYLKSEFKNSPEVQSKIYKGAEHSFEGFEEQIVKDVTKFVLE